jgi:plastocyanin
MKLFLRFACALLLVLWLNSANATIHTISVADFAFTPNTNATVVVGDTIRWVHAGGTHTTTSTSLPSGAAPWDSPITAANPQFDYKVTVAGSYGYRCDVHPTSMTGTFTATAASAIGDLNANAISLRSYPNPATEAVVVEFNLPTGQKVGITATDLAGRSIELTSPAFQAAGNVRLFVPLANRGLAPGMYTLCVRGEGLNATQRVVVQ